MKNASEMRALMWDYHTPNFYERIAEIEKQMEETVTTTVETPQEQTDIIVV